MKLQEIEKLISIIDKSNLTEIKWKDEKSSLTLKKEKKLVTTSPEVITTSVAAAPVVNQSPSNDSNQGTTSQQDDGLHKFKSPIVGTFYESPSPNDPVFVKVGDKVKKGQVVCIIEAMKLMNEIEIDVDGVIEKILINNETPVEFGTPLFAIKTS